VATLNPEFKRDPIDKVVSDLRMIGDGKKAVDGITSDWWSQLVANVSESHPENIDAVKDWFKGFEAVYKEAQAEGHKTLPTAYRSSKSTINKAYSLGVAVLDANGFPKPKTSLVKEMKEVQEPKAPVVKARDALEVLKNNYMECGEQDRKLLRHDIEDFLNGSD